MSNINSQESDNRVKVLVSGAVMGQFSTFSRKLGTLHNSKAGPFDICFCVGPFFDNSSKASSTNLKDEALALLCSGKGIGNENIIKFPMPVYFMDIGRLPDGVDLAESHDADSVSYNRNVLVSPPPIDKDEICIEESPPLSMLETASSNQLNGYCITKIAKNLYRLKGTDIVSIQPSGLVVAYTSSTHVRYGSEETEALERKAKHVSYIGCDLFLTSEWGQGIASLHHKVFTSADKVCAAISSITEELS
jgi:hypothetical protein